MTMADLRGAKPAAGASPRLFVVSPGQLVRGRSRPTGLGHPYLPPRDTVPKGIRSAEGGTERAAQQVRCGGGAVADRELAQRSLEGRSAGQDADHRTGAEQG